VGRKRERGIGMFEWSPVETILSDLSSMGYEVSLDEDKTGIRFKYLNPGDPPDAARELFDKLRRCKNEAIRVLKDNPPKENAIQIRVQQELQKFLSNPNNIIEAYQKVLAERDNKITELAPKAAIWDIAMGSDRLEEMSAVAKILNFRDMGRNNLFDYLRGRGVLRKNNEPYQRFVDSTYFKIIEQTVKMGEYTIINNKTMVTQKGLEFIAKMLREDGYELNQR